MATRANLAGTATPVSPADEDHMPHQSPSQPFLQGNWRQWLRLRWAVPYLFLAPFLVVFVAFFVAPFLYDVSQSFYALKHSFGLGLTPPKVVWVGLDNYVQAVHDQQFWGGFGRVILFGVVQIPVMLGLALLLALLLDSATTRFRRFFRLSAFVPYAVPSVVAAIMWGFFYIPSISPVVQGLATLHAHVDFLGGGTILWSIANISTWEYTGYNMVIVYAALQAIPQEIYESGRLDGLSEVGIARYLKVPMIRPALALGILFSIIGTLQLFNEPEILRPLSTAISTTYTPNVYAYNAGIVENNFYYGGAIAAILGIVTFVFSFIFIRVTQRDATGA